MGDAHDRGVSAAARAGARYGTRLTVSLGLIGSVFVLEVAVGLAANSLALLSDAGHMLTDVVGLGMALAAIHVAGRASRTSHRTFGLYRLEILAALANAVLLVGVAVYVLVEAGRRLSDPPDAAGLPMLVVAAVGLVVNLVAFGLLREGASHSLNVRGAYLEVLADLLGSVGVLVAGALVQITGWASVDPIFGAAIGLFILPRSWRLGGQALRILLQAAPPDLDLTAVEHDLRGIEGVLDVHDLHFWTLTSGMEVGSAHVRVGAHADARRVMGEARAVLRDRYRVGHATLQVEPEDDRSCAEVSW